MSNNIITRVIRNPRRYLARILLCFPFCLSDSQFLKVSFMYYFGYPLDLSNPKSFSEKLQWLKLYDRKPHYTTMVDKYAVKQFVADIIGERYIIPTFGVWNAPEDIDWNSLPSQFVLKTTHGGGGNGVVICTDKNKLDKNKTIQDLRKAMKSDLYKSFREWPYKNVQKRIIAEKFISQENSLAPLELLDYKFFCFNGKVKFFKVDFGRFVEHHANYYSPEGKLLEFGEQNFKPDPSYPIELPQNLKEMISLAEILSKNIAFLRVDFYNLNGNIYFGELTFYPASGFGPFTPEVWDLKIGDMIFLKTK